MSLEPAPYKVYFAFRTSISGDIDCPFHLAKHPAKCLNEGMNTEQLFFRTDPKARWGLIVLFFLLTMILDFSTPPQYILGYLYIIPILISISFLKPRIAKILLALAVFATLMNLVLPISVLQNSPIVVNRLLAALAITVSAFFMVRYIRYQNRLQEQEGILATERQLAQMREDFIATLTHDLKTPLLGGEKTLQYLNDGTFGPLTHEQKDVIGALQRSNQRQLELVQTLVSTYKIDNVGAELVFTPVDMDDLVADIVTELQYLAAERKIHLNYVCQKAPSSIRGDALQLKRVVANLVHNALNYTPANGSVCIQLQEESDQLLVQVSDTGPGIPAEDLDNIFNRFYRAGDREVISTGLGLYLSRQIITAHRGQIWIENLKPGCRFSFALPKETAYG